ncbi:polysaccharide deacetylase [Arthrobacter sp. Hiyo8]|nr:polysaccharide deacetylase [Arthrobacter sp. Hiyo8]
MNITVANPTSNGFITAYAGGTNRPATSNLNFAPGQIVPNFAITPVGSDGTISFTNSSNGTVQLIADITGYSLTPGASPAPGTFSAQAPFRQLDTRDGTGGVGGPVAPDRPSTSKSQAAAVFPLPVFPPSR